jgi:putative ABC transport system permease protein
MLALQRILSVGYFQRHWLRAVLVILSIALGVATMVATRTLSRTVNLAAQNAGNPLAALADLQIVNGQAGVPAALADRLMRAKLGHDSLAEAMSAIKSVQSIVYGRVVLPERGNQSVLLLGIDLKGEDAPAAQRKLPKGLEITRTGTLADTALILAGQAVPGLVSADLASDLGLKADNPTPARSLSPRVVLRMAGQQLQVLPAGIVTIRQRELLPDRKVVFLECAPAARLIYPQRPEYVTLINLALHPGTNREAVRRQLQQALGPPVKVQTIAATNAAMRDVTAGLELAFAIGGVGALVVGMFLVYNVLSVTVAERRHEIGILRSVGATRTQVLRLFVAEALVLGLIGSLLGLPLGWLLAQVVQSPVVKLLGELAGPLEMPSMVVDTPTLLLALAAGAATAVLAALVPAFGAAQEDPADVVRRLPSTRRLVYRLVQGSASVSLILAAVAFVHFREALPVRIGTFAGFVCILLTGLVATPLLAVWVGRLVQPFFGLFLGLEGRLAADNLARSPGRTGLVVAALSATTALMVQTAGFIHSSETAVLRWLDESVAADLLVTAGAPLTAPGQVLPMSEAVTARLRSLPQVDAVLGVRYHVLPYHGRLVVMGAVDGDAFDNAEYAHSLARLTRFPRLREPGTALVSQNFAALYKVRVRDTITVDGLNGPLPLEVIGTVVDYTWNRGTIIVNRAWYRERFRDPLVDIADVYLKRPGGAIPTEDQRQAEIQAIRSSLQPQEALHGVTHGTFRTAVASQLHRIYSLAYAQEAIVGLVALLGVVSALFISVLQRRRELGLLRAVGASRRQVLRSVLAEAVLMGVVGALLGFAFGLLLEWYVLDVMVLDESGLVFPLRVAWQAVGVVAVASVLLATLVGLWPAWQATRVRIAEAIAYE